MSRRLRITPNAQSVIDQSESPPFPNRATAARLTSFLGSFANTNRCHALASSGNCMCSRQGDPLVEVLVGTSPQVPGRHSLVEERT